MAKWYSITVPTTGNAGAATGAGDLNIPQGGLLCALDINYTSMPATTDLTISEVLPSGNLRTLLTLTDTNTDTSKIIQLPSVTSANVSTGAFVYPAIGSTIRVSVAQGDAATAGVIVSALIA